MRIEVIKENSILPVGSVAVIIKENKTTYRVLHGSMVGSFEYTIPKSCCEIVKGKTRQESLISALCKPIKPKRR